MSIIRIPIEFGGKMSFLVFNKVIIKNSIFFVKFIRYLEVYVH